MYFFKIALLFFYAFFLGFHWIMKPDFLAPHANFKLLLFIQQKLKNKKPLFILYKNIICKLFSIVTFTSSQNKEGREMVVTVL